MPGDLVDAGHLRRSGEHHQEPGLLLAHVHARRGRRLHVRGHRPPDRRARARLRRAVDERQLHDRGQLDHALGRRGRRAVLVLRLGRQVDRHPAEHEPDHDGHDRAPEERQLGYGRPAGTGGSAGAGGAVAPAVRRGGRCGYGRLGGHGRPRRASGGTAGAGGRGGAGGAAGTGGRGGRGGTGGMAGTGGGGAAARPGRAARAASSGRATSTRPQAIPASRPTAP